MNLSGKSWPKLLLAGGIIILACFYISIIFNVATDKYTPAKTIEIPNVYTLEKRFQANENFTSVEPYKKYSTFLSPEIKTDFAFSALGFEWEEHVPVGTDLHWFVRFKQNGAWAGWYEITRNIDEKDEEILSPTKTAFLPVNPSESFQYKVEMTGNGIETPTFSNIKITYLNANDPPARENSLVAGLTFPTKSLKIISRAEWGADESLRVYKPDRKPAQIVPLDGEFLEKFSDELKIVKKIKKNEKGEYLTWPLEYPAKVSKIIIHHTATTKDLDNPKKAIRDIYYWHAISRGWGDTGYNYTIDPEGNIYEGRAGGEGVVSAHAGKANVGSIGVAILGNYETQSISEKAMKSLTKLIAEKARLHGIDAYGNGSFRGEMLPNIIGHRDVMNTACPGENIYDKLVLIRRLVASNMISTVETPYFKKQKEKGYDYEDQSETIYISLDPEEKKSFTLKLKNTGSVIWDKNTFITVNDEDDFKDKFTFEKTPKTKKIAYLEETRVNPGETGTFHLTVQAEDIGGLIEAQITPVVNNTAKLEKYIILPIAVNPPIYSYEFLEAKWPKEAIKRGTPLTVYLKLKNTGNITWQSEGLNKIRIGADNPRDHKSSWANPPSPRLGFLVDKEVKPGKIGTFKLTLQTPWKVGQYTEYLTPVVEGRTWMENKLKFTSYVYKSLYDASVVNKNSEYTLEPGETDLIWVKLKNAGGVTWKKSTIGGSLFGKNKFPVQDFQLLEAEVKPGEIGTLQFAVTVPEKEGLYTISLRPQAEKTNLMAKVIPLKIRVAKKAEKNNEENPDIRIALKFKGSPIITGNGPFALYEGNTKREEFTKDQEIKVEFKNNTYVVTRGSTQKIYTSEVRFIPLKTTILQIRNFEQRPSWNKSLNDNQYRGILEVRNVDGELKVIDELPLEDYLKGIAENSSADPQEKVKAIIILARTYALYYITEDQKFPGKPYHLTDDAEISQKYLGYSFEMRASNTVKAVYETKGMIVTYDGKLVKTPYFSQSDGRTRSAEEIWGWTYTPYLVSVLDPDCEGLKLLGHGVGLSACGARAKAKRGESAEQIIKYYFKDVELKNINKI